MACKDGLTLPLVRVCECYGEHVDIIFPCHIHQLPRPKYEFRTPTADWPSLELLFTPDNSFFFCCTNLVASVMTTPLVTESMILLLNLMKGCI